MMWLKQLGGAVESTEGQWNIAGQVLLYAVAGNLAQYFVSGPSFGGMSGVVYGLFGFIWICGKYDPNRPYALDRMTVGMMLGWAVLCLTGALGPIANTAHFVGLFGGIVWAAVTVRRIPFTPIRF
jgi:GlpG protein